MPIKYEPALLSLEELRASRDYALKCQVHAEKQRDELLAVLRDAHRVLSAAAAIIDDRPGLEDDLQGCADDIARIVGKAEGTQS